MLSGDRLKFLRYTHKKTQKEIADWCNVSTRYVGMVESGEEIPSQNVYHAWLNCCYGIGKPLPKVQKANSKKSSTDK
jgi:transcriptional regulator with XRE-family HTH domain